MLKYMFLLVLYCTSLGIKAESICKEINISAHPNYPPFHWQHKQRLMGASISASESIFKSIGVQIKTNYQGPWPRVLKNAKDQKIDFIPALKKSPDREKYLVFTDVAFSSNPVAVFMRANSLKINSLDKLEGLHGSINRGDKHGGDIDSFIQYQPNFQVIQGIEANFDMLQLKRTDYFINGYFSAIHYLKINKREEQFTPVLMFEHKKVHNAFTKRFAQSCPQVVQRFQTRLKALKQKGFITSLINEYNQLWLDQVHQ